LDQVLFEAVSAFATVGLSTGITGGLPRWARSTKTPWDTGTSNSVGVNGFFTALIGAARASVGDAALGEWLNASQAAEWVDARCRQWGVGLPQLDGYGHWHEAGRSVAFFLEWDAGTETHRQLSAKLERYAEFAGSVSVPMPWVLFVFPAPRREANVRAALRRVPGVRRVPIATTSLPDAEAPERSVWLPLSGDGPRSRLSELSDAGVVW
jgi:hypothetical protein